MKKKTRTARKVLSVFLSVLMILTTLTVAAPGFVLAAGSYYVRVYLNIYDGANSDGYGNAYTVVTDPSSEFYGKPDDYKWDYGSSWSATDNSKGYDGEVNMAGFTLFYDNDKKYKTYDLSADLVAATTTLGNNWTSMDDLTLENFASWPNKVEKVYDFELDSLPSSLFWINDENNAINGETSFGIYKITVAETSTGPEHTLWSGLSGSESYYECYYGTITPTGLITPWDDCPDAQTYTFYKDYTTSAVGTWIDPYNAGEYNTYPVNNYLSGGVSATFTVGNSGSQTNTDYVDVGNTNNYFINFTNHSTQEATVTLFKDSSKSLVSGYSDGFALASGQTKSFVLNKGSMSGDGTYYDFSFKFKLNNVYNSDGTTQTDFYQAAGIGTWDTTDDLKAIGLPAGESSNAGFTIQGSRVDVQNRFMVDNGILEETKALEGNRTTNVNFEYTYWLDSSNVSTWQDAGLRMYANKWSYYRLHLQPSGTTGTINITGDVANTNTVSISMADLLMSYNKADINVPDKSDRPWAYYNSPCTPYWQGVEEQKWGTLWNDNTPAYFPFCGEIIKGSTTSTNPGKIVFTNMTWRSPSSYDGFFSGTINVYSFDKTDLRNYVYSLGGLGANWAPMRNRFSDAQWNAYEIALKTAKEVLANQKTNQKAVTDAYNNLYSATEALKATASLKSQVAEVTYTKRTSDYDSAVTDTTSKYIIMPIGTETAVPAYDTYKYATSDNVVGKQSSNLKTNYTQYDTGINPIDYRYWKIDFSGVDEAIAGATALLDSPLDTYSDAYYEAIFDARTAVSYFDRDADTWTPTHQSDVSDPLSELNALLAHSEDNYDACIYDGDDEDDEADIVNEKFNCVEGGTIEHVCIICGKAKVVENVAPSEGGHTVDAWTPVDDTNHKGNCTACGEEVTASHIFTNPVLTRPTEADGVWSDGTYTYTCVCGATKTEPAVRADYAAYDKAVEDLNALLADTTLTEAAKTEITNVIANNAIDNNLVTEEQTKVDDAAKALKVVLDKIANDEAGAYEKVDYTGYNSAVDAYDALDGVMTAEDKAAVEAIKAQIDAIPDDGSKKDYQQQVDDAAAAIVAINAKYGNCADGNHSWSEPELTKAPTADEQGEYTETCLVCGTTQITKVDLADYDEFNAVVEALENLANTENLTTEAAKAIADALAMAEALDKNLPADATTVDGKLIEGGQDEINALVAQLQQVVADTNTAIGNGSALKPDTSAAEEAVKNAEALEEKIELPEDVKTKIDELRTELDEILKNIEEDDNATAAEYQTDLDAIKEAANEIIEKYAACEKDGHKFGAEEIATYPVYDEASDTWSQGTYTKTCEVCGYVKTVAYERANYEAYDKAVADLNSLLADDNLTAEAKAEINKALTDNAIRYDLMTPDQSIVDAAVAKFVAEYNKITNDETGAYEKPDYTEAEEAIENAEALDSITDDDKAVLDGLKEDLEEIKNKENPEATAKDDQDDVDAIRDEANKIINKYSGCEADNHTDVETDGDHNCDVCGKLDVTSHNYVNPQLTRPVYDEEKGEWSDGYYTSTCNCGDTSETTIARADYEDYDKAVADLNALLNTGKLTQTAVVMINAALEENDILDDYVKTTEEQAIVDNAAAALQLTLGELTDENGLKKEYEKVDFTNYKAAVDAAKALEDVMTPEDKAAVEAEKQKVTDAGITEETSKAAGQQILDDAAVAIAAINAKYGDCADGNHNWGDPVLTTEPSEGKQGEYTETCLVCGTTQITKVDLADYDEFNAVVEALENLANTENLTTEAAKAIADALNKAEELDKNLPADATTVDGKLIEGGQDEINALVAQLQQVVANTNTAIGNGSALLPDYDAWNEAEGRYDALDKTNVKAEIITEANNLKDKIAKLEANDELTQATATQDDINKATARLNEIIDGITDGTLKKDADFTDVDKDLADAKEKAENNDVIDGVKEDIKEIEDKLNELRNDPTTNIEDQDEIDALEKELEDIIAGIEDGSIVKPNYTEWDKAETAYDALDKTMADEKLVAEAEALKTEIAAKEANETLTQATATQDDIDEATKRLNEIVAEITGVLNSKPDFNGYDGSHDEYEALVEQYGGKIKDSVADDVAALDTIVEGIRDNENATKGEYQDDIDDAKTDLDAIIAGIKDGSLRDPDYTDVEEKLDIVNGTDNLTPDAQDKIDEIEEALEEIRNKEPEANANDQPYIDILEKQLDEILDAIEDGSALVPDYTDWEAAEGAYDALVKDNVNADIIAEAEALKAEIAGKQADKTLTQATATQVRINEATARLNEIIDGIEDGSLIKPADFTEVDKDLADAKEKAENNDVIDGVKEDIKEIEDALNDLRDTATAEDQKDINDLEDALEEIIAGIEDGSLVKPDYEAWEAAEGTYDELDKTNVKDDIITEANALKAEIAGKQADDTLTQATATQKDIDDATARLNEIIDGIEDGSLKKDADFTEVDKDLADAKDKANNNDVIDGVKEDIKEIEDRLNELKNDPTTNIEDQPEIDDLEEELEDIIAGIEDGSLVKPDYTDADEAIKDAEGDIDNGGKLSDEDKAAIDELKEKLDEIKNDPTSNKKDDQPAVDSIKDQIQDIIKDYAECIGGEHKYEEKVVLPTCTEGGYTEFTCTVCGKNYRGNEQPSTGHVEDTLPAREPTCSEVGLTEGKKCIVCGEILVAQKEIAKLSHVDADDDGVCDHCHYSGLYDGCACLCHNNHWFWHIVYLIIRIIWRVFKIHPVCPCGRIHY